MADARYNAAEYQRNRRLILADRPVCAIRGPSCTTVATTVDHIVEAGDNSLSNLRPACAACNSARGGRYGRAVQTAAARFLDRSEPSRSPDSLAISPTSRGDAAGWEQVRQRIPKHGRKQPRLSTPVVGDGSLGADVVRWVRQMARRPHVNGRPPIHPPMPWHVMALDRMLATSNGRLCHRQALISTARQNGKSWLLEMLVAWWMLCRPATHGPQNVAWIAHDLRLSELSFHRVAKVLEPYTGYRTNSFGRQRVELLNGSSLAVQSNTPGAGHGNTYHLVVADECWRLRADAIELGLGPTQRAVKEPLMVLASTAGDESSTLLRGLRERALTSIEAATPAPLAMLEWSMSPAADPWDSRRWGDPNPCLGTTLEADTLVAEAQGDRNRFLRGSLNVWTASADSWLEPGVWDACLTETEPDPSGGAIAVEVSMSGERFAAVRAWTVDGVCHVAVIASTESQSQLWDTVAGHYRDVATLAITPPLDIHLPDTLRRKAKIVGMRELARWVPLVRNMIAAGQVTHHPSMLLDEHVARAVATTTAGLSTAHSSGEISLARCLVWAVTLATRPTTPRRPAIAAATV